VGEVKIDRSFVGQMPSHAADAAIVGATIQLAHSLGLRVVSKGSRTRRRGRDSPTPAAS
jgi:EAL domain-containing protein (putative c-di-GMP-specific phosphodiesterase class I)